MLGTSLFLKCFLFLGCDDVERSDYLFDDDVIWQIFGEHSVVGATYKVIEIVGYTVEGLNMIRRTIRAIGLFMDGDYAWKSKLFLLNDETNDKWIASKKKYEKADLLLQLIGKRLFKQKREEPVVKAWRERTVNNSNEDGKGYFLVIIGEILDAKIKWDRGREVTNAKDSFAIIIGGIIDANKNWDRGREIYKDIFGEVGAWCSQIMVEGSTFFCKVFILIWPQNSYDLARGLFDKPFIEAQAQVDNKRFSNWSHLAT